MKLSRLPPNSRELTSEAAQRAQAAADESRWHVGAAEGAEADRQRSAQEELESAPVPPAPDEDQKRRRDARALAEEISELGPEAARLLRPDPGLPPGLAIDTEA